MPTTVSVNFTGTAGLKVAGKVVVDGVPREFAGVSPTNITVEARTFEYIILMQEPRGELSAKLTAVGGLYASASATNDLSGVRGYSHTWGGRSASAVTTRKGGDN